MRKELGNLKNCPRAEAYARGWVVGKFVKTIGISLLRRKSLGLRSTLWEQRIKSSFVCLDFITLPEILLLTPGHIVPPLVACPRPLGTYFSSRFLPKPVFLLCGWKTQVSESP